MFGAVDSTGEPSGIRTNLSTRMSQMFTRRSQEVETMQHSQRASTACSVPIFMSQPSDQVRDRDDQQLVQDGRASQCVNADAGARRLTFPASSIYSQSPRQHYHQTQFMEEIDEEDYPAQSPPGQYDLERGDSSISYATSETNILREQKKRRRRRAESLRQQIEGKKRLGMAFGVCLLASVITYLVLAVTKTAHGLMFHVLSVLFIIILAGIFLHSTLLLMILQKRRRARVARHRDWHGTRNGSTSSASSRSISNSQVDPFADKTAEKAVPILEGPEEVLTTTPRGKNKRVVKQPPPVYGNFRSSKRMNPELVFWHKQNPSPTTPTYEEALQDVQSAVGYQPPQYVSPKREIQMREGQRAPDVHPLERERLVGLMGNTMSSHHR